MAEGLDIRFISTRRPKENKSRHAFTVEATERTSYLFPPDAFRSIFLLFGRPRKTAAALQYIAKLNESGVIQRIKSLSLLLPAAQLALTVQSDELQHLHVHSFANAAHVAALAHILCGIPYSLTLHGDLPVYGRDHASKVARAAFVTVVTRPLREQMQAAMPSTDPLVIAMGVDIDHFAPDARSTSQLARQPLRLTSISRLHVVKGHADLLDAMKQLVDQGHDIVYRIAGDGNQRPAIEAKIKALGLGDRVTLLGSISEQAVRDLLNETDVFALTSFGLGEAAPVAVMEAMACGIAVICSRIGGTGDMIIDGHDGILVKQRDIADIASALARLASNAELRLKMGENARQSACERFDYRLRAAELAAAIYEAAARK